jgi:SAM-dependent methyltransferase
MGTAGWQNHCLHRKCLFFGWEGLYFRAMNTGADSPLDEQFWTHRYLLGQTGWDIGYPSVPLLEYINQLSCKELKILIPGCGNAYEAAFLLEKGFTDVTLLDISAELVRRIRQRFAGQPIRILQQDFFEHDEQYDLILEQTFFCALDPRLRSAYVQQMHSLLKPGGKLVGVLFNRSFEGGPPFGGSKEEYELLFSTLFSIKKMELCYNSIPPRRDTELFFILQKIS